MNNALHIIKRFGFFVGGDEVELFPLNGGGALSVKPDDFMSSVISIMVMIGTALAFFLVVFGGYKFMTSGGDVHKVKDGRDQIQNALLGFLLILLSVAITYMIYQVFGIDSVFNFSQP